MGIEHTAETVDPEASRAILTALKGKCDGRFVTEPDGVLTYEKSEYPNGKPMWSPDNRPRRR
ncbi:hypothetical protein GOARA_016_00080 [Gordonia araii NBRC 100433]|uniref:Uncharacterized protein n=1 Tax=Gordonia araii NBRC 100433 TaxID=1073574 RepID=G7GYM9_9ACTN|nr:hypothetical protein [Gordonia araii]NNG99238.1 hypothetical protein [Gordonia araii NBRC 100433]GAB08704.1 hypothetical protein GOARA_016_00080 [Gordonia araii NBRC 100433]